MVVHRDIDPAVSNNGAEVQDWPFQDVVITDEAGAKVLLEEADWTKLHEVHRLQAWATVSDDANAAVAFTRACLAERDRRSSPQNGQHLLHKFVGFKTDDAEEEVRQAMQDQTKRVLKLSFFFREAEEFCFTDRAKNRLQG